MSTTCTIGKHLFTITVQGVQGHLESFFLAFPAHHDSGFGPGRIGTNQWWDGSNNLTWPSGSNAAFGNSGSGKAVTLASPTSVGSITFNNFSGTYTLGSTGQALTINDDITNNSPSGAVLIISPVTLSSQQTWANHSSGALSVSGAIGGSGGITKTGSGTLVLRAGQNANNYTGNTVINGGILQLGTSYSSANNIPGGLTGTTGTGASNLEINGGTVTQYYYMTRTLGSGPTQIQITGGRSGFTNKQGDNTARNWRIGNDANNEIVWGSAYFNPTTFVMQDAAANPGSASYSVDNKIDLNGATRTVEVGTSTGTLNQVIRNSSGTAGLIKVGNGQLILSAINTYNGDTTVSEGSLQINSPNTSNEASTVTIAASATLDLNFSGTDTVDKLFVDGAQLSSGVYKAIGSAASGTELAQLIGAGTLTVSSDPPAGPGPDDRHHPRPDQGP